MKFVREDEINEMDDPGFSFPVEFCQELPDVDEVVELTKQLAKECLERDGRHVTMMMVWKPTEGMPLPDDIDAPYMKTYMLVDPLLMTDDPAVAGERRAMIVRMAALGSDLCVFICEGWLKRFEEGEISPDMPEEEVPRPSDFPVEERDEVLLINVYVNRAETQRVIQGLFTRDEDGNPHIQEWTEQDGDLKGRMFVTPEMRAAVIAASNAVYN